MKWLQRIRFAIASHIAHGDRDKIKELLKLSNKELWKEFDEHGKSCPMLKEVPDESKKEGG